MMISIILLVFLVFACQFGTLVVESFLLLPSAGVPSDVIAFPQSKTLGRSTKVLRSNHAMADPTTEVSPSAAAGGGEEMFQNRPLSAPSPRAFDWWDEACDAYLDELDRAGGEPFIASHDEPDESGKTNTQNWLHVTSSNPSRRVQYEIRYVGGERRTMGGVIRFGADCEGPEGCAHGGSIASVADALTATCCFKASGRWGMTTRLECNYREAIPLGTPVRIEATILDLKKRKASLEWAIYSLTKKTAQSETTPVRHAFGSADFLLPRPSSTKN